MADSLFWSAAKCLSCDTVLISKHRHDFVKCECPNEAFLDGGSDYIRCGTKNPQRFELGQVRRTTGEYKPCH